MHLKKMIKEDPSLMEFDNIDDTILQIQQQSAIEFNNIKLDPIEIKKEDTDDRITRINEEKDVPEPVFLSTKKKKPCPYCGKYFRSCHMKRHIRVHTGERPFSCDICQKAFKQLTQLEVHQFVHMQDKHFKCDECAREFTYSYSYKRHLETHKIVKQHCCNQCDYKCPTAYLLKKHMIKHTNVRAFKCEHCSLMFKSQIILTRHMPIHNQDHFKCEVCAKVFGQPQYLKRHMKTVHVPKTLQCEKCSYNTTNLRSFKSHERRHEKGVEFVMIKCEQCDFSTYDKLLLMYHARRHKVESLETCQLCEYSTRFEQSMRKHIKNHHGGIKNVECLDCDEVFLTRPAMEAHKKRAHRVTEFQCKLCSKYFSEGGGLRRHVKSWCKASNSVNEQDPLAVDKGVSDRVTEANVKKETPEDVGEQVKALIKEEPNFEQVYIKQEDEQDV